MPEAQNETHEGNPKLRQFIAAFTATLSAVATGAMIVWTAPVLPILTSGKEEPQLSTEEASWVGSLLTIGAFVGCFPAGKLADLIGRKKLLLSLVGGMTFSWALLLLCGSVWGLCIGRLVGGFMLGVVSVVAPVYIADIAQPSIRGALGVLFQFQLVIGVLIMYCIGLLETVFMMNVVCAIMPFVFVASFVWMPESPAYLVMDEDTVGATKALQWLRATEHVEAEVAELKARQHDAASSTSGGTILDLVKTPVSRKAISLTLGLMFFQQCSGINAVLFYTVQIFEMSDSTISPNYAAIFIGVCSLVTVALATVLIEKTGRRVLLMLSSGLMGLFVGGLALYIEMRPEGMQWLPIVCLTAYCMTFSIGLGPIPWIMMAELFPSHLKSAASSVTASASWGFAFIVTKFFSGLVEAWGIGWTFALFGAVASLGVIFVALFIPETKAKNIEEILIELGERPSTTPKHGENVPV